MGIEIPSPRQLCKTAGGYIAGCAELLQTARLVVISIRVRRWKDKNAASVFSLFRRDKDLSTPDESRVECRVYCARARGKKSTDLICGRAGLLLLDVWYLSVSRRGSRGELGVATTCV